MSVYHCPLAASGALLIPLLRWPMLSLQPQSAIGNARGSRSSAHLKPIPCIHPNSTTSPIAPSCLKPCATIPSPFSSARCGATDTPPAHFATHLPLVVKDEGEHGLIEGHFATANRHWQALAGRETLVVFSGPHSYVSPTCTPSRSPFPPGTTLRSTPMARFRWSKTIPAKRPSLRASSPERTRLPRQLAQFARRLSPHHAGRHHGLSHPHRAH